MVPKHILVGHAEEVSALAFSPDSLVLASGSEDRTIRIWDPAVGQLRTIYTGHRGKVHSVSFIGSGTILFSASKDRTICEWDMMTSELRKTMEGHTNTVWDVAVSKCGTQAVSVSHDETIRFWVSLASMLWTPASAVESNICIAAPQPITLSCKKSLAKNFPLPPPTEHNDRQGDPLRT